LTPLVGDRFLVVTGRPHEQAVRAQLPTLGPGAVLAEPSPRDSMAAIGLAAAVLERRAIESGEDVVMGSFAADHVITDRTAFHRTVVEAVETAREDWLVTIGIEPTFPSSAFGYIRQGDGLPGHERARVVDTFVEKPSVSVAEDYLATGAYRWNAGMFVVRPGVLLDLLAAQAPDFAAALRELGAAPDRLDELWPGLPKIAIDHAVAEPAAAAGRVATVPGNFGWDDVGDYDSLAGMLGEVEKLSVLGDDRLVLSQQSTGLVVPASGRVIAVIGLDDVIVVDTPDGLLVASRERAQDVKAVVAELKDQGRSELT
jgi:mannose-1-phosphate guanylyltransferase